MERSTSVIRSQQRRRSRPWAIARGWLFAGAAVYLPHGCVPSAQPDQMVVARETAQAPFSEALLGAMCLGDVRIGEGAIEYVDSAVSLPSFRAALAQSLAAQGLLAGGGCRFRIDADLAGLVTLYSPSLFGGLGRLESFVAYRVRSNDGTTVLRQTISASYVARPFLDGILLREVSQHASEGAMRANFAAFLDQLRQLKL